MREVIDFIVKETLEKEKPKMIINNNNNKAEKRKKPAKDYLQKQLDMIADQKKKKEELYLETLAKLTAKYDKEGN
jgi:vacuolar-type H+-ATPase subunit E/Vma4